MRVKVLAEAAYRVVGVMSKDSCPALDFLTQGEKSTEAVRAGLLRMLVEVANRGLDGVPSSWHHEADKRIGIYEFIKGPLRLFFFKGSNGDIAVCTSGVRKSGNKADKAAVSKAVDLKLAYTQALANKTYEVVEDENE